MAIKKDGPRMMVRFALFLALGLALVVPSAALGRAEAEPSPALFPEPAEGTVPVRFSVAGPVSPENTRLVLLAGSRSCGVGFRDQQHAAVHAAETDTEVLVRLDMALGPAGTPCVSTSPIRVPVELTEPLGERTIRDAGADPSVLPLVNHIDPIDTGFRYSCDGVGSTIADLLGPGLDVSGHGPSSNITIARAIVNRGDGIEFLGPLRPSGTADWEAWWFHDGGWERNAWGKCRPRVELSPGLDGATWSLQGRRPGPEARRIEVRVRDSSCASGRSPAGRIARPIIQVRRESIVIILGIEPLAGPQDCQGTPPAPFVVRLPVALGDRALYDGGVFPPREILGRRR